MSVHYQNAPPGPFLPPPARKVIPNSLCYGSVLKGCMRPATGTDGLCTYHATRYARHMKQCFENELERRGWTLRYVEFCEDGDTPGLPGAIAGVTMRARKEVKVSTRALDGVSRRAWKRWGRERTIFEIVEILRHEMRHVADPDWDCGNRAPWAS